jgi:hypothetical protein
VLLQDQNGILPPREIAVAGASAAAERVPLELSLIRVRFSKVMDGSTIQRDPPPILGGGEPQGNLLPAMCAPAANVVVTKAGGTTSAATFAASVCYDPSGPDMVVEPAVETCSGPVAVDVYESSFQSVPRAGVPGLERGATYTIQATGVKDHQGHAITFTFTVTTGAVLDLAFDPADATVQPVQIATYDASGAVAATVGLDEGGAPPTVPTVPSPLAPAYGPDIQVRFDAPMCRPQGTAGSPGACALTGFDGPAPGAVLAVAGQPLGTTAASVNFAGGYQASSGLALGGDVAAVHLVPWLPLEDGQAYTLSLGAGVADVNGAPFGTPRAFAFQADAGEFRVQVALPADGTTGVLPTTDLGHLGRASTGHGIEFVLSRPVQVRASGQPVGTIEVHVGDAAGPLATFTDAGGQARTLSDDVVALDTRNRWFAIGATTGQGTFALEPGQAYTVVLKDLVSAAAGDVGVTIPTFSWTFTTAPFSRDAALSIPVLASAIDTTASAPVSGAVRGTFLAQYVVGRVKHVTSQPVPAGTQFLQLLGAAGATPTVSLTKVRDAQGRACTTGCEVAGTSGYVVAGNGLDPWAAGTEGDPGILPVAGVPHSVVGFLPEAPLDNRSAYQLTLTGIVDENDVPLADADANGVVVIPFTTTAFQVQAVLPQAALTGVAPGDALQPGARFVTVDGANPLTVQLSAAPDPATTPSETTGDLANDPIALVDAASGTGVPLTITYAPPSSTVALVVAPKDALKPNHTYTLLVTSRLRAQAAAHDGTVPLALGFTTNGVPGAEGLVCQ